MAAPIAPDSPQCGCTMIFGCHVLAREALLDEIDLRLDRRQVVLRAALQHEVACPRRARFGICATYSQMFFGSTAASPAMISSGFQPCRWKSTMSDCMNTAQP